MIRAFSLMFFSLIESMYLENALEYKNSRHFILKISKNRAYYCRTIFQLHADVIFGPTLLPRQTSPIRRTATEQPRPIDMLTLKEGFILKINHKSKRAKMDSTAKMSTSSVPK